MKPMNWISATGLKPVAARPIAVPMMALSAAACRSPAAGRTARAARRWRGTRRRRRPRPRPARAPSGSRSISSRMASRMAWAMVSRSAPPGSARSWSRAAAAAVVAAHRRTSCGKGRHLLPQVRAAARRTCSRKISPGSCGGIASKALHLLVHPAGGLLHEGGLPRLVPQRPRRRGSSRMRLSGSRPCHDATSSSASVAAGVVGGGVVAEAVGDRLDQGGAVARAGPAPAPRVAATYTASTSLPSTWTPGMP